MKEKSFNLGNFLTDLGEKATYLVDEEGLKMSIMLKIAPKEYVYIFMAIFTSTLLANIGADAIKKLMKKQ